MVTQKKMEEKLKIGVYWRIKENGKREFDEESMREEFEGKLIKLKEYK